MDYMALFPSHSRSLPRFSALAGAILSQVDDLIAVTGSPETAFSVGAARGRQLDAVGASFLFPRPEGLSDADYRACLAAKLALYTWDGANDTAQALLDRIFPGSIICDNGDGTVTLHPASQLQADYGLFPVPAGVGTIIS